MSAKIEFESPEAMLTRVEEQILTELTDIARAVTDRRGGDITDCKVAFLRHLMSRRNTLLRRMVGRRGLG